MRCWRSLGRGEQELFNARRWRKTQVALRGLYLTSIPYGLCQPPLTETLVTVDLSYNRLCVLPDKLAHLVNLERLYLRHNKLCDLPESLRNLQNLCVIDVSHNEIHQLPECLSHLLELQVINLSGNSLTELTSDPLFLPKLQKFFVTNNPIQNVPRAVYLDGVAALRKHFRIETHDVITRTVEKKLSVLSMVQCVTAGPVTTEVRGPCMVSSTPLSDLILKKDLNTSDYGSCSLDQASESPHLDLVSIDTDSCSCYGDRGSDSDQDFETDNERFFGSMQYESDSDSESDDYVSRMLADRTRLLKYKNIVVIIPQHNRSGLKSDEFHLDVIEDVCVVPETTDRAVHASQVVLLEPHGSLFYDNEPALVHIPLGVQVDDENQIICLCSDTDEGEVADWQPMDRTSFTYDKVENRVTIRTFHFSLFTVVIAKSYPSVSRHISAVEGGKVKVKEVPGVEVDFPKGSLEQNIEASVKVFYGDDPFGVDTAHEKPLALATPVVMLGPHGCMFNQKASKPVTVRLPIPHCREIMYRLNKDPRSHLTVWQSDTTENEALSWKQMDVDYSIEIDSEGNYFLCIPLQHFSWYRALWDILSSTLHECKIGVAYFYPYIQFSMMCVAMMESNNDSKTFGLEVICYRSDKKEPEVGNYKHRVGRTIKPKMMRPGPVIVRLASNDFEADTLHGEDASLTKIEPDFRGREFEKQFACTFKGEPVEKGVFGKVHVEKRIEEGVIHPIFEFNLTKSGQEGELLLDSSDGWSLLAVKELASMLNITTDDNWRLFAKHLGFTQYEIKKQLAYTNDPFAFILLKYQNRGGTPDEFVQALYEVGRKIRVSSGGAEDSTLDQIGFSQRFATSARVSDDEGVESEASNPVAGPSGLSTPNRKRSSTDTSPGTPHGKRRRKASEDLVTNSSEMSGSQNDQAYRESKKTLTTEVLWRVSRCVNQKWKYLGRTLDIPEEELLRVEHQHRDDPWEATYQMLLKWKDMHPQRFRYGVLFDALCQNGLNSVAQNYVTHKDT